MDPKPNRRFWQIRLSTAAVLMFSIGGMPIAYMRLYERIVEMNTSRHGVSPYFIKSLTSGLLIMGFLALLFIIYLVMEWRASPNRKLYLTVTVAEACLCAFLLWSNSVRNCNEQIRVFGFPFEYRTINGVSYLDDEMDGPKMWLNGIISFALLTLPASLAIVVAVAIHGSDENTSD